MFLYSDKCFHAVLIHSVHDSKTHLLYNFNILSVGASEFFLGFICNCFSYFTTAKISFTAILYPQFTHMIFITYTSHHSLHITGIN